MYQMRRRGIGSCHRDQKKSNLDPVSFYFFSCFDRPVFFFFVWT